MLRCNVSQDVSQKWSLLMPTKTKPKGRPKGEGYVYQDSRGYWYARLTVAESTGKRRNIKRVARSRTEAQDILRRLVREE